MYIPNLNDDIMGTLQHTTINKRIVLRLMYNINLNYFILYVLAMYYYNGEITEAKYKGQIKSLRAGNLAKWKGTYHCELNDRWSNQESALSVFEEALLDLYAPEYLTADKLVEAIMLYTGKSYNYCLNILYQEYIYPMIDRWANTTWADEELIDSYNLNIQNMRIRKVTSSGYCCWECGNSTPDEVNTSSSITNAEKDLLDWLHTQKKGNLAKIPKYDGIPPMMGW